MVCAQSVGATAQVRAMAVAGAHVQGQHLLSGVEPGEEPDLARLLLPHQARHVRGPVPGVKAAHLWARLPKHAVLRRYLRTK